MPMVANHKSFSTIIERHADDAAFLWCRRAGAARSIEYDLDALYDVDIRLDAHLEGLTLARRQGLDAVLDLLESADENSTDIHGELFAAFYVAASLGDAEKLDELLGFGMRRDGAVGPIVSALGWLDGQTCRELLGPWSLASDTPWRQAISLHVYRVRREDPGPILVKALESDQESIREIALRAVGEFGRRDLLPIVRHNLRYVNPDSAGALWTLGLLGDANEVDALWASVEKGGIFAEKLAPLVARKSPAATCSSNLKRLSQAEKTAGAAIAGAAGRGDTECIPWLLDIMATNPAMAVRAAITYATIVGAMPEEPDDEPNTDHDVELDDEDAEEEDPILGHLPSPELFVAHWSTMATQFPPGVRFLGGRRMDAEWLAECLRSGHQRQRELAAQEQLQSRIAPTLFPIRAPGYEQLARLES